MTHLDFEDIPSEILQHVASFFDHESVSAFALANKRCNEIANVFAFRTVSIDVYDPESLRQDMDRLTAILDQRASFRHVRRLILDGRMYPEKQPQDPTQQVQGHVRWNIHVGRHGYGDLQMPVEGIGLRQPDRLRPQVATDHDKFWIPLATFLCRLPALRDLIYECRNQVPPCLLSTLHEKLSNCRLHIRTFSLRSLEQRKTDPQELALAGSSCLHSFMVARRSPRNYWPARREYVESLLPRVPLALAPNLREASVICCSAYDEQTVNKDRSKLLLQFLSDNQSQPVARKARLHVLTMRGPALESSDFQEWSSVIDFSALRALKLEARLNESALRWATENALLFQSLSSLIFKCHVGYLQLSDHDYQLQTASFLRSLPPLAKLRINDYLTSAVFDAILKRHGPSLRILVLTGGASSFKVDYDLNTIDRIRQSCPRLTDLHIRISRSKSDESDLAIYQTLGMIQRLQTLHLELNCSNQGHSSQDLPEFLSCGPSSDESDQQFCGATEREVMRDVHNGRIRDALTRSQVDENLARSIFQCISAAKANCSDPVLPLENLVLMPIGGDLLGPHNYPLPEFGGVDENVRSSWQVERKGGSYSQDDIVVRRLRKPLFRFEVEASSDYK